MPGVSEITVLRVFRGFEGFWDTWDTWDTSGPIADVHAVLTGGVHQASFGFDTIGGYGLLGHPFEHPFSDPGKPGTETLCFA